MFTGVLIILLGISLFIHGYGLLPSDPNYMPRHLAGRNPYRDEIQRSLTESRRRLRRSPAPWSHLPKRHSENSR